MLQLGPVKAADSGLGSLELWPPACLSTRLRLPAHVRTKQLAKRIQIDLDPD